ncbi:ZYRO0F10780p [Zygosaccharomyces rouxii]|uniref:ZYRO0F10780p n=1 Tax=Zygosaccharomyces rouxii (strain ATCC 2623 / CBS 732 / NBRC 1130 / NCYC 568 / NRRL Y-229) TaxID=559307 RepID=C5DY72_ZYGRC|nr:uncharacterized protein ZYRO0F10780g [Zygosaccharomyces rouxii]KAH9199491.1 hypothetical protein LQ764DRAFT_131410 [Zygosaccharomyces rouxii]CAR28733.1 ZYRO0F10780p [Zygosaccharomyces rouxii]
MPDPLDNFYRQFQLFVQNNPNVISAARAASQIPESAKAVVVLSPYSLEHSFGRNWVSKSYLKSIVERPERLLASSLGIAAAITMYPALYTLKSSDRKKSSILSPHVLKVHGKDWPPQLLRLCKEADAKLAAKEVEVPASWNAGDIYLSSKTVEALQGSIGALETAVDSIFDGPSPEHISNRAFVAIRPPGHHCHVATPSGFCLLNNAHVAIEYAKDRFGVTHAAILDFDLHHGDGTQDICWKRAGFRPDEEDEDSPGYDSFGKKFAEYPRVGYFSMHDINSFPTESGYATKENVKNASTCIMNAHDVNIWNIHLSPWETEEDFAKLYHTKYRSLFVKADEFFKQGKIEMAAQNKPFKGLVVISSGFDASEFEQTSMQRHGTNVPTYFYTAFTKDALKLSQMHCHGKVLSIMEGGYSDKAIVSGVFAHLIGLQNQNWIKEWGSEHVVKEIVRGCKSNWKPYKTKKARDVIRIWAEEVIKLGRAMIPGFETLFQDIPSNNKVAAANVAPRVTRSKAQTTKSTHREPTGTTLDPSKETPAAPRHRRIEGTGVTQEPVPFTQEELHSEDDNDDEDYVYDEELNKTFNRTVEDITIDDISRHLETLEIIEQPPPAPTAQSKYKVPSKTTTQHLRSSTRPQQLANSNASADDSDISMVSHVSTRKHTTRSGARW